MGHVHQISTSRGGVPKLPVDRAVIDESGVSGDEQADKVNHGSPDQALCLYSLEVIESLQREGHPIQPGSAGDNITVAGLDWLEVVPGTRLVIGPVEIEITDYTGPCEKNAQWFKDGRFSRMLNSRHPGESRIYAKVLKGGAITTGDPVELRL
ncbi:MAG TPA: MOSC domain-containing protein [Acidimicrobiia bacterium]